MKPRIDSITSRQDVYVGDGGVIYQREAQSRGTKIRIKDGILMARRRGYSPIEMVLVLVGVIVAIMSGFWIVLHAETATFRQASQALHLQGDPQNATAAASVDPVDTSTTTLRARLILATMFCFASGFVVAAAVYLNMRRNRLREESSATRRKPPLKTAAMVRRRMIEKRNTLDKILRTQWQSVMRADIKVGDLMSTRLITVPPNHPHEATCRLMEKEQIHHLLVVDAEQTLLGIISDRDAKRLGHTAAEIMTPDPVSVNAETDIKQAITMLLQNHYSALPVTDQGRAVGMLTSNDLIATLHCTLVRLCDVSNLLRTRIGQETLRRSLAHD